MTLDEFLSLGRSPTAADLAALCGSLGFRLEAGADGSPVVVAGRGDDLEAARAVARVVRREPWRSSVLSCLPPTPPAAGDPLPLIIYWRPAVTPAQWVTLPDRNPRVPFGAAAWSPHAGGPWRPVSELPESWNLKRRE